MKILYVASEPAVGMVPFAVSVVNSMAKCLDFEVKVLVVENKMYDNVFDSSVSVVSVKEPQSIFEKIVSKLFYCSFVKKLRDVERDFQPDVVHFLTDEFRLGVYNFFLCKRNYVYTVHDLIPHESSCRSFLDRVLGLVIRMGCWLNTRRIENLVTCSVEQCNSLKRFYPQKKISMVNFPTLVLDEIKEGRDVCPELIGEKDYFLFFGRVDLYKGVDILINAFEGIKDESSKLVIAGRGELRECENVRGDILHLNRYIKNSEIAALFKNSKCVIYPYMSATMSGVLSLAFYFNKQVILSDIPFFNQYSCDLTVFFQNKNVTELQEKMETLPSLDLKSEAYNLFYSEKQMIQAYRYIYENL